MEKQPAAHAKHEADIGGNLQAERTGASGSIVCAVAAIHSEKQAREATSQPCPAPRQHPIGGEQAALEAGRPDADAREEVDGIVQRAGVLEPERADLEPLPRREGERQRHVGDGGSG